MVNPKYYVAVFGDPNPPYKDTVESGKYNLGIRGTEIPTDPGDIILLYCTMNYPEHFMEVPGIGIVLNKDKDSIYYRYLPVRSAIKKDIIDKSFTTHDKEKFNNIRFSTYWLFEITRESFSNAIGENSLNWP